MTYRDEAEKKCRGLMTITCGHVVVTGIVLYFVVALAIYGSKTATNERDCAGNRVCLSDPDTVIGPFCAGLLWPVYVPMHLSYLLFR